MSLEFYLTPFDSTKYLSKQWEAHSFGEKTYDCWGLVWAVYRDHLGIELVTFNDVESGNHKEFTIAALKEARSGRWQEIDKPEALSVVLMGDGKLFHHVGLYFKEGYVLHSCQQYGVCLQPFCELIEEQKIQKFKFLKYVG